MADKKITALTAGVPVTSDIIPYVSSPGASPSTKKTTIGELVGGWIAAAGTWTYASASTITIPTDGTTTYRKFMKIRFKQGAGYKYYICSAIAATTLTVFVNTDHTVANAAITDVYYSFHDAPYGFPTLFNYAPTLVGISGYTTAHYTIAGNTAIVNIIATSKDVTGVTTVTLSHPFTIAVGMYATYAMYLAGWSFPFLGIASNIFQIYKTVATGNWLGSETAVSVRITAVIILA